jgi:hypothetical protein
MSKLTKNKELLIYSLPLTHLNAASLPSQKDNFSESLMLSCIFFMHNWISFSTSSSVREVSVITSDFSVNYLSVLLGSTFNKKNKIRNYNIPTKGKKGEEHHILEYGTKKFKICVLRGYIFPDK